MSCIYCKRTFLALGLLPLSAFSFNPVNGWYAGGWGGGSVPFEASEAGIATSLIGLGTSDESGTLKYSIGGGGGLTAGYRNNVFRGEGSLFAMVNNYDSVYFPILGATYPSTSTQDLKGSTGIVGFMLNAYYDHFTTREDGSLRNYAPYIGVGVGGGKAYNKLKYYTNGIEVATSNVGNQTTVLYQGILGFAMYFDDYSMVSLDYRYLSTGKLNALNTHFATNTINISFNFWFDQSAGTDIANALSA